MAKKNSKKNVPAKPAVVEAPKPVLTIMFMAESNWNEKHVKPVAMEGDENKSSRSSFLHHVKRYNGRPVALWAEDVKNHPPARASGKNAYTPKQWMTWFVKAGVVELVSE